MTPDEWKREMVGLIDMVTRSVLIAQRQGVRLDVFLETQWRTMPPGTTHDTKWLMMGVAVVAWMEAKAP